MSFHSPRMATTALPEPVPELGPNEARALAELIRSHSGISLSPDRIDFLRGRLGKRLRSLGHRTFASYIRHISSAEGSQERLHLIEAMTTHTTGFFREAGHFDWLRHTALPEMAEHGCGKIRPLVVWSAACSIGAELWSAGMVINQFNLETGAALRFDLVGTDISRPILRRASEAIFTEDEITGLPEQLRQLYLLRGRQKPRGAKAWPLFRIAPELRNRARFSTANLLEPGTAPRIEADVVFLRNVLIYFTPEDQVRVVQTVASRIRSGGYLLTGHSESAAQGATGLDRISTSIYRKV
jgi:chemotaxis protein methyltransferase CheR